MNICSIFIIIMHIQQNWIIWTYGLNFCMPVNITIRIWCTLLFSWFLFHFFCFVFVFALLKCRSNVRPFFHIVFCHLLAYSNIYSVERYVYHYCSLSLECSHVCYYYFYCYLRCYCYFRFMEKKKKKQQTYSSV